MSELRPVLLNVGGETFPAVADALAHSRSLPADIALFIVDGDEPRAEALAAMIALFAPDATVPSDVVYADEDRLDASGCRTAPFHKPRWSPDRLRSHMYLTGLVAYRTSLWADAPPSIDRSLTINEQLHALALWATGRTPLVTHLPTVACHRRTPEAYRVTAPPWLQQDLGRAGSHVEVRLDETTSTYTWEPAAGQETSASIIIPTGGGRRIVGGRRILLVENAVHSILERSTHTDHEIILVIDRSTDPSLAERMVALDPTRIRYLRDHRPFNFAAANNLGASEAVGDVLVLLNDDAEVVTPNWIERLSCLALADGVGAVGARLHYGDGRLQHAGLIGRHGSADHRYRGYGTHHHGHGGELLLTHNVLAVTAACLAISRRNWSEVGGMDEAFPLNYNDLDLCLRLYERGRRNIQDNRTILNHLETSSRVSGSESWEDELVRSRWSRYLHDDPYDNPNLIHLGFSPLPPPAALNRLRELTGAPPAPRFPTQAERLTFRA